MQGCWRPKRLSALSSGPQRRSATKAMGQWRHVPRAVRAVQGQFRAAAWQGVCGWSIPSSQPMPTCRGTKRCTELVKSTKLSRASDVRLGGRPSVGCGSGGRGSGRHRPGGVPRTTWFPNRCRLSSAVSASRPATCRLAGCSGPLSFTHSTARERTLLPRTCPPACRGPVPRAANHAARGAPWRRGCSVGQYQPHLVHLAGAGARRSAIPRSAGPYCRWPETDYAGA